MNKKLFAVLAVLLAGVMLSACGTSPNDFNYRTDSSGIFIISYKGTKTSVTIPDKIKDVPVVIIGDNAFKNKGLKKVKLPKTLKVLGRGAFVGNNLKTITLPDSLEKIYDPAFDENVEVKNRKATEQEEVQQ